MPIWPHPHGEFRYCPACGDVWRVARRGQTNPRTGIYTSGIIADQRARCMCRHPELAYKENPLLRVLVGPPDAIDAVFRVGGDKAVRALVPAAPRWRTNEPVSDSWDDKIHLVRNQQQAYWLARSRYR